MNCFARHLFVFLRALRPRRLFALSARRRSSQWRMFRRKARRLKTGLGRVARKVCRFLGNGLQLKRDPLGFLTDCARIYGDVVRISLPVRPAS